MIIFLTLLLFVYSFYITQMALGIVKINNRKNIKNHNPEIPFSIIVPFRNEAENLPKLLESISKINYPIELFEVILVNDDSVDNWKLEHNEWKIDCLEIKNIRKSNSPKKDAIESAIKIAKHNWIVTTDADCQVPENWLQIFNNCILSENKKMLVGSVLYNEKKTFLHHFQNNDFLSLQGVTAGSFGINQGFMCNGANFAYEKKWFFELNGFEGNNNIASGDDVFLLQKAIQKNSKWVHYLGKSSIVTTTSCSSWSQLINQRIRWASKTSAYTSLYPKIIGSIVFLCNLGLVYVLTSFPFQHENWKFIIYFILLKFGIDFMFMKYSSSYYQHKFKHFVLSFLLYPFFTNWVVIRSFIGKYQWKNRYFNQ